MNQSSLEQEPADSYYRQIKIWMLPFVADGPNSILDLGCATGLFGSCLLQRNKASTVDGVELFEKAAKEAAQTYRQVHVGDIEQMNLRYTSELDYVICGDILEHLKDPYAMVEKIWSWLKPGGSLLVCMPNIRNYLVLRDLIFAGEWRYVSAGILDRTHLRFFTRKSGRRMLEEAGFRVTHEHMVIEGSRKRFVSRFTGRLFDEFLGAQMFLCARKPCS